VSPAPRTLVLALGNELLSDDGVGVVAADSLRERLAGLADVVVSPLAGVALLETFLGYERALVLDAIRTGPDAPGTIRRLSPADLGPVLAPSPHYSGLPEMIDIASRLRLSFPSEIAILSVEVSDPYTIGGPLSEPVRAAIPELARRVVAWIDEGCRAAAATQSP
jgi:hydrogenase maturation protease